MYKLDYDINKLFDIDLELFKSSFLKIINSINDERVVNIITAFAIVKPIIKFKTIFCILEEFNESNDLMLEFNILKEYINKNIDIFMLSNYLIRVDSK